MTTKHELVNIVDTPGRGLSGECTCRKWARVEVKTVGKLRERHGEHVRETGDARGR